MENIVFKDCKDLVKFVNRENVYTIVNGKVRKSDCKILKKFVHLIRNFEKMNLHEKAQATLKLLNEKIVIKKSSENLEFENKFGYKKTLSNALIIDYSNFSGALGHFITDLITLTDNPHYETDKMQQTRGKIKKYVNLLSKQKDEKIETIKYNYRNM